VSHNLELKVSTLNASAEWLTGEVEKQAALVRESDLKLAQYKESQDAGALDSSQNCGGRFRRLVMTSSRSRRC
jgi:hypothetical protein